MHNQSLQAAYAILPMSFKDNGRMPFLTECEESQLICAGKDVYMRDYYMHQRAYQAWQQMQQKALQEGVALAVVSAYRSYLYQANIILKKLNKGILLEEILKVSALPGFSEHHTGCALDLTSGMEDEVLTEQFENTLAFEWLNRNAHKFRFYLSYPRDNPYGIVYEPWHWCYQLP